MRASILPSLIVFVFAFVTHGYEHLRVYLTPSPSGGPIIRAAVTNKGTSAVKILKKGSILDRAEIIYKVDVSDAGTLSFTPSSSTKDT